RGAPHHAPPRAPGPLMPGIPELTRAPGRPKPIDPGPRWPLVAGAAVIVAALGLALYAVWPDTPPVVVDARDASVAPPPDAGLAIPDVYSYGATREVTVSEPSPLPRTL